MSGKIFLYLIIIGASGLCGILKALRYSERYNMLLDFINALEKLRIEMEYRRDPIPVLCRRISGFGRADDNEKYTDRKSASASAAKFFKTVADCYEERRGVSISYCWRCAVHEIYEGSALKPEDTDAIIEIGDELGSSGTTGQHRIIELSLIKLRNLLSDAEEEKKSKGKMCMSLGFAIGITIVILLI